MKHTARKRPYKRIALALSLCALILWGILGTGASLAWFTDTAEEVNNIFHFADFEVAVSHRLDDGTWEAVDSQTKVFNEEDLYEPGHVQVVYLKVENTGDRAFSFHTAVNVNGVVLATNVFGQTFSLQDHLRFGLATADTETAILNRIPDRETAKALAQLPLHNYASETAVLQPGGTAYVALVVRMPEDVGNIANYRGDTVPEVELGITVKAEQLKK